MTLIKNLRDTLLMFFTKNIYDKVFDKKISFSKLLIFFSILFSLAVSCKIYFTIKNINFETPQSLNDKKLSNIISQFPTLILQNNKLSASVKQPFYINDENNNPLIIIDTLGNLNSLNNSNAYLLLTKTRLIYSPFKGYETTIEYSSANPYNNNILINEHSIKNFIGNFQKKFFGFNIILIFCLIFINIIWKICFKALILASLSFLYFKENFVKLFQIFAIASFPLVLLQIIYLLLPQLFIIPKIFFPIINLFYIYLAFIYLLSQSTRSKAN